MAFDPELLADVNTAVTEACNNVIQHAYDEQPGPLLVELSAARDSVDVRVRDWGCGIRAAVAEHDGLKVGLALMSAVADRAEFINVPEGGTEVRLAFRRRAAVGAMSPPDATPVSGATPAPDARPASGATSEGNGSASWRAHVHWGLSGDVLLTVSPVALLAPVLGRIGRALAPSAGFSLQRCSDVYLLSDLLGAHAERAAKATSISVALGAGDRRLEFALAPLRIGTSAALERPPSPRRTDTIASLTEDIRFTAVDGHETLQFSMRDHLRA